MGRVFGLLLLAAGAAAQAQSMEPLMGLWESPDGAARQQFSEEFSGLVGTRMWFKMDGEWKLAGQGFLYRRPGESAWTGATRTIDMGGFVLFESVITPMSDGKFHVQNKSFDTAGGAESFTEDWDIEGDGTFDYRIYRGADDSKEPWMAGRWVKISTSQQ